MTKERKDKPDKNIADAFKNVRKDVVDHSGNSGGGTHTPFDDLLAAMSEAMPDVPDIPGITKEDKVKSMFTMLLVKLGVSPEEYAASYEMLHQMFEIMGDPDMLDSDGDNEDPGFGLFGHGMGRKRTPFTTYTPIADAAEKTLVLKIQMKGVTKPPMWREVEIPANYNFEELHEVIQIVAGLENCHLWQFNKSAYDDSLQIGIPMDENDAYGPGLDYITDDARETPLTKYLAQKGDELEYVYDFGDDWIFTVKVQKITDTPCETPKCVKWKSDLDAIDDFGGPYAYEDLRLLVSKDSGLTKKEKNDLADNYMSWFETRKELFDFLNNHMFDPVAASERLGNI